MAAALNGIAHSGLSRPCGGTFLVFPITCARLSGSRPSWG